MPLLGTPRVLAAISRILRGDSLTRETISQGPPTCIQEAPSPPTHPSLLRTCNAGRSQARSDNPLSRAPGAAGRIRSGHAGQTRRQLQPLRLQNLQHRQSLTGSGFAPRAGGGLGAGPLRPARPHPDRPGDWNPTRGRAHAGWRRTPAKAHLGHQTQNPATGGEGALPNPKVRIKEWGLEEKPESWSCTGVSWLVVVSRRPGSCPVPQTWSKGLDLLRTTWAVPGAPPRQE